MPLGCTFYRQSVPARGSGRSEPQGKGRGLAPGRETDAGFGRNLLRDRSARRLLGLCPLTEEQCRNGIVDRTVARAKWGIQLRHLHSGRGVEALVSVSARRRGEVRPARIGGRSAARSALEGAHL